MRILRSRRQTRVPQLDGRDPIDGGADGARHANATFSGVSGALAQDARPGRRA